MKVSPRDPLSMVQLAPISTPSSKITFPTWGVLKLLFFIGINPNPFNPTFDPSWILTKFEIIEFLIVTKDPIIQFSPIKTLLSIILLLLIKVFAPILTFFPIKTFLPNFTPGYKFFTFSDYDKFSSGKSMSARG